MHFFGDNVLLSRTHSPPGSTNIFTGVSADWNVVQSLYSIADIQSCIDKVRPVRFGEHLVSFVNTFTLYSIILTSHKFLTYFSRIYMNSKLPRIVQVIVLAVLIG